MQLDICIVTKKCIPSGTSMQSMRLAAIVMIGKNVRNQGLTKLQKMGL